MSSRPERPSFTTLLAVVFYPLMNGLMAQVEWTAGEHNPVIDVGAPGTWNWQSVFPYALIHRKGEPYRLWYRGSANVKFGSILWWRHWQLGCASSDDLANPLAWQEHPDNPCLRFGFNGPSWDVGDLGCSVLFDSEDGTAGPDGTYKMWYGGVEKNDTVAIGFATSSDGINWNRRDAPILKPDASWEHDAVFNLSVLKVGTTYRMWYTGRDLTDDDTRRIGYATSPNGIELWEKHPGNPVLGPGGDQSISLSIPHVLFDEDTATFEMWYSFNAKGATSIGYATSLDGVTWCKYTDNPLVVRGEPATVVFSGPVLREGDRYHMLYSCIADDRYRISYATSLWTLPRASFTLSPETGDAPLEITADVLRSATPAGSILSYSWDFGDGDFASGGIDEAKHVTHSYSRPGEYLLKLTAFDSAGHAGSIARKVRVSFPCGRVDPWTSEDIGKPSGGGCARFDGDCFEVLAGVGNLAHHADTFQFLHQEASGDFCLTGLISDWDADIPGAKIGLVARESLEPGSAQVAVVLQKLGVWSEVQLLSRTSKNADLDTKTLSELGGPGTWLRLERRGKEFIGSSSSDGVNWIWMKVGPAPDMSMTPGIRVGVVATELRRQEFRDFEVGRLCNLELAQSCTTEPRFRRGDANSDVRADLSDAVFVLSYLFVAGPAPSCLKSADADDNGSLNITDPISLLTHLFLGGPQPPEPFAGCGTDGTQDELSCEVSC